MNESDGQQPASPPESASPPPASGGVAPEGMQAAPGPDTPLFEPPRMEAITASDMPPNVNTSDSPDR
ncbi:MAG TPA: hypothetical protein VK691_10605 [Solirubrobacteraceae bacterium]|jgi:hypothetical protein|nr:hypothetical protein [Solirubrobacteraceae bacterium]